MPIRDYYQTLQVTPDAEPEVIAAAYKRLAFKYHPDRNQESAADSRMRDLNEAYETLGDPQKRKQYDAQRNAEQMLQQFGQYVHGLLNDGQSPDDAIKNLMQMGIDLETSARIVGTVVEIRRNSATTDSVPTNSPPASPDWWSSNWGWIVVVVVVIGGLYLYSRGGGNDAHGQRLAFGKCKVYFTTGVEQGEAQKIGDLLVREKYFADQPADVQVRQLNGRYEVRFVIRAGAAIDPQIGAWEELGNSISWECLRGSPVDIHLCDENLKSLRVIPLQHKAPLVKGFESGWATGTFTHDFLLTNTSGSDLSEAEMTIIFYREDGQRAPVKKFWSSWKQNETKRVNVPSHRYQKMEIQGTAIRALQKVRIDTYWTQNWN